MEMWEYKRVHIDASQDGYMEALNRLGMQGWEVISVVVATYTRGSDWVETQYGGKGSVDTWWAKQFDAFVKRRKA